MPVFEGSSGVGGGGPPIQRWQALGPPPSLPPLTRRLSLPLPGLPQRPVDLRPEPGGVPREAVRMLPREKGGHELVLRVWETVPPGAWEPRSPP